MTGRDPGGRADLDGGRRLGARGIHHPDEAEQRHLALGVLERRARLSRDREHTEAFARHAVARRRAPLTALVGQRDVAAGR